MDDIFAALADDADCELVDMFYASKGDQQIVFSSAHGAQIFDLFLRVTEYAASQELDQTDVMAKAIQCYSSIWFS